MQDEQSDPVMYSCAQLLYWRADEAQYHVRCRSGARWVSCSPLGTTPCLHQRRRIDPQSLGIQKPSRLSIQEIQERRRQRGRKKPQNCQRTTGVYNTTLLPSQFYCSYMSCLSACLPSFAQSLTMERKEEGKRWNQACSITPKGY